MYFHCCWTLALRAVSSAVKLFDFSDGCKPHCLCMFWQSPVMLYNIQIHRWSSPPFSRGDVYVHNSHSRQSWFSQWKTKEHYGISISNAAHKNVFFSNICNFYSCFIILLFFFPPFNSHGNKEVFSCWGIQLAVDFFLDRGHNNITVFVPSWRKEQPRADVPITGEDARNVKHAYSCHQVHRR